MIGLGFVLIVFVGIGVVVMAGVLTGDDPESTVAFNGEFLPAYDDEIRDPVLGVHAPIFVTHDLDGNRVVTGGGGGPNDTGKVIAFVAHWCPICQTEVPEIARWLDENVLPGNVELFAVSTFEDQSRDNHPPVDWFDEVGWPTKVLADSADSEIATAFGFTRVPSWVVLDAHNEVLLRTVGAVDDAQLAAMVELAATATH
jgi:thiol-disulfide isomerase/thioredoxin